jgi:hypothetical protein
VLKNRLPKYSGGIDRNIRRDSSGYNQVYPLVLESSYIFSRLVVLDSDGENLQDYYFCNRAS